VHELCDRRGWQIVAEYTEIESGKRNDRPALAEATAAAKRTGATLLAAKLDRVGRRAARLLTLLDEAGVRVMAADAPDDDWTSLAIKAVFAQSEGAAISRRTRDALRAAKARGVKLGNPNGTAAIRRAAKGNDAAVGVVKDNAERFAADLAGTVGDIGASGKMSLSAIAAELNARHIQTRRGGQWYASSVRNLLARL
jgi:DNA invertase Pin-like site-specific DNA recombinase